MSLQLAYLPSYPAGHNWSNDRIELFADPKGRCNILPPNFCDVHIKRKLGDLTTLDKVSKKPVLSTTGEQWTDEAFPAYAYLDRNQRDEFGKPCVVLNKTCENKLAFALFVQNKFGTGGHTHKHAPFINHLRAALRSEMIRRCQEVNITLPNGDVPCSIDDVLAIFKSDEMTSLYKNGDKEKVYNYLHAVRGENPHKRRIHRLGRNRSPRLLAAGRCICCSISWIFREYSSQQPRPACCKEGMPVDQETAQDYRKDVLQGKVSHE